VCCGWWPGIAVINYVVTRIYHNNLLLAQQISEERRWEENIPCSLTMWAVFVV